MDGLFETRRHSLFSRTLLRRPASLLFQAVAATAVLGVAASCSTGPGAGSAGTASTVTPPAASTVAPAGPVTAELSQFRDNYGKQIIEIQLTNTIDSPLTVLAAALTSPLFAAAITWPADAGGIELPPGQTKSLPAHLPAPQCGGQSPAPSGAATASGGGGNAVVSVRLARSANTLPDQPDITAPAADPFGVLARNNSELCLAQEASAVAMIGLAPALEVATDGRTAVVRLLMKPRDAGPAAAGIGEMVIDRIEETTLLAEAAQAPWPRSLRLRAGEPPTEVRLGIRPARCDPHAVAEDKVGTLLPLRVKVAGREGVVKIDAGDQLRARVYNFVTTACGRQ